MLVFPTSGTADRSRLSQAPCPPSWRNRCGPLPSPLTPDRARTANCAARVSRATTATLAIVGFLAYGIVWIVIAIASDPTWWWFVPVYGAIQIFQESTGWGIYHVSPLAALWIAGLTLGLITEN